MIVGFNMSRRLGRGADGNHFEAGEVAPLLDPSVEQRAFVAAHELKAAAVVEVDPAVYVLEPGRELAAALARAAVDLGRGARVEVLNDHVQQGLAPWRTARRRRATARWARTASRRDRGRERAPRARVSRRHAGSPGCRSRRRST